MITVHLKNGQALHFPDGTDRNVMRAAIAGKFPDQIETPMEDITKAVANDVNRIQQGGQPTSIQNMTPQQRHLQYENPEDVGRAEGGKRFLKSGIPELFASLLMPALPVAGIASKIPSIGRALQSSPRIAQGLQTVLGNAIPQAGISAAFNPEHAGSSAAATGALTGGIDTLASALLGNNKYTNALKSYLPSVLRSKTGLMRDLGRKISPEVTPEALEAHKLAKQHSINLRPDEATRNVKIEGIMEGLGRSPEGARNLQLYQEGQDLAHGKAVEGLNQKIYNPGMDMERKQAYEALKKTKLSPEGKEQIYHQKKKPYPKETGDIKQDYKNIVEYFSKPTQKLVASDKNVKAAIKKVGSDPVWQEALKDIPKKGKKLTGTFLDTVKKEMDHKITQLEKRGATTKAGLLTESKNKFVNILDEELPTYERARSLHERKLARETIEDLTKAGKPHGKALADYLKDSDRKKELVNHLRNVEGGKEIVDDLHEIFSRTKRIDVDKLAKRIAPNEYKESAYSAIRIANKFLSSLKGGAYDKAAIELMTSKEWPKKLKELEKTTKNEEFIAKLSSYLNKSIPKRFEKEEEPELK